LRDRIVGCTSLDDIIDPVEGTTIVTANTEINEDLAAQVSFPDFRRSASLGSDVRSRRGICVKCYGRNLATGTRLRSVRLWVSSPHSRSVSLELSLRCVRSTSVVRLVSNRRRSISLRWTEPFSYLGDLKVIKNRNKELISMRRQSEIALVDERGREVAQYKVVYGLSFT
jgi:DNA-directed RNA polymerase subunit beta'